MSLQDEGDTDVYDRCGMWVPKGWCLPPAPALNRSLSLPHPRSASASGPSILGSVFPFPLVVFLCGPRPQTGLYFVTVSTPTEVCRDLLRAGPSSGALSTFGSFPPQHGLQGKQCWWSLFQKPL